MKYFDVNSIIGTPSKRFPWEVHSVSETTREMDYFEISSMLVRHAACLNYSPCEGNEILLEEISGSPRYVPCWDILPNHLGEMFSPEVLLAELEKNQVPTVTLCSQTHGFPLSKDVMGDTLIALESRKIPLLIEQPEAPWSTISDIAASYPELPIILLNVSWWDNRTMFPQLKDLPNIHLEISNCQAMGGIEYWCSEIGASRIIFGSGYPVKTPGAALATLNYAQISEAHKESIAWKNLCKLLNMDIPDKVQFSNQDDSFLAAARKGTPVDDELIIDSHGHTGSYHNMHTPVRTLPEQVQLMHVLGVDSACVSSMHAIYAGTRGGNAATYKAIEDYPERFKGYVVANPNFPEEMQKELDYWLAQEGVLGIKLHPTEHNYPLYGENYNPVWDCAMARDLPVLSHGGGGTGLCEPEQFRQVLERFPDIKIIYAHAGGTPQNIDALIELTKEFKNLYLEITYSSVLFGIIEKLVKGAGADRILFGTDVAFRDPRPQFGWLAYAKIDAEAKRKVFGLNMKRLLSKRDSE